MKGDKTPTAVQLAAQKFEYFAQPTTYSRNGVGTVYIMIISRLHGLLIYGTAIICGEEKRVCGTVDKPWYRSTTTPSMDYRPSLMNAPTFLALGLNAVL